MDKAREEGAIQIPTNARSVRKLVVPPGQRLLRQRTVHMIKLGQAGVSCAELDQLTASRRELARKSADEDAGIANLAALSEAPLQRSIGTRGLCIARSHGLCDQAARKSLQHCSLEAT